MAEKTLTIIPDIEAFEVSFVDYPAIEKEWIITMRDKNKEQDLTMEEGMASENEERQDVQEVTVDESAEGERKPVVAVEEEREEETTQTQEPPTEEEVAESVFHPNPVELGAEDTLGRQSIEKMSEVALESEPPLPPGVTKESLRVNTVMEDEDFVEEVERQTRQREQDNVMERITAMLTNVEALLNRYEQQSTTTQVVTHDDEIGANVTEPDSPVRNTASRRSEIPTVDFETGEPETKRLSGDEGLAAYNPTNDVRKRLRDVLAKSNKK